jgi:hypothetical protein
MSELADIVLYHALFDCSPVILNRSNRAGRHLQQDEEGGLRSGPAQAQLFEFSVDRSLTAIKRRRNLLTVAMVLFQQAFEVACLDLLQGHGRLILFCYPWRLATAYIQTLNSRIGFFAIALGQIVQR